MIKVIKLNRKKRKLKKKLMSKLTKQKKISIDLINKMFEMSNHNLTYEDIKGREDDWYDQHTMTQEQQSQWYDWGVEYIMKKMKHPKNLSERIMGMLLLGYGLKVENYEN